MMGKRADAKRIDILLQIILIALGAQGKTRKTEITWHPDVSGRLVPPQGG